MNLIKAVLGLGFPLHKPYIQLIQVSTSTSILGTWKFWWIRLYSKFQPSFSVGWIKIPQDPRNLLYAPQKRRSNKSGSYRLPLWNLAEQNEHKKPRVKGPCFLIFTIHQKFAQRKPPFLEFPITQTPNSDTNEMLRLCTILESHQKGPVLLEVTRKWRRIPRKNVIEKFMEDHGSIYHS